MKRNIPTVLFVLIVLVVLAFISASCNLGSPKTTSTAGQEPVEPTEPEFKPDMISAVFTVNGEGKQVVFSPGALYWDGLSFKMEENQYDFRTWSGGKSVINGIETTNGTPTGHTGLFYWSKDVEKTYAMNYNSSESTSDTFALAEGDAIAGWNVLSDSEWSYLVGYNQNETARPNASSKYGLATITTEQGASVKGLVLLPDTWILPDGCNWTAKKESGWTTNNYNAEQWTKMEQAGAVFLPAMGYRDGSSVYGVGDYGLWWTSSPVSVSSYYAFNLYFRSDLVVVSGYYRNNGNGVRLVAPIEN